MREIRLGDRVKLKKPHPCGGDEWEIKRLGADIGLICLKCGRYILIPRSKLERKIKELIHTPLRNPRNNEL